MRNRNVQLNIRLTPREYDTACKNSRRAGLPMSAYLRMLINGYRPIETPPLPYNELIIKLNMLQDTLQRQGRAVDAAAIQDPLLQLQAALTQPQRLPCEGQQPGAQNGPSVLY